MWARLSVGGLLFPALPHCSSDSKVLMGLPGMHVPEALTALFLRSSISPGSTESWAIGEKDPVKWLFGNVVSVSLSSSSAQ